MIEISCNIYFEKIQLLSPLINGVIILRHIIERIYNQ